MAEQWMCYNSSQAQAQLPSARGSFAYCARNNRSLSKSPSIYTHSVRYVNNEIIQSQLTSGPSLIVAICLYGIYIAIYSDVQKWLLQLLPCNTAWSCDDIGTSTGRNVVVGNGVGGCGTDVWRDRSLPSAVTVSGKLQHVGPVRWLCILLWVWAFASAVAENAVRSAEQWDHPLRFSHRPLPSIQFGTDLP